MPGVAMALPLVVTVTTKLTAAPFVMVTFGTLQFAPWGVPEHTKESVPMKPAPGVASRLNCAVWPALTEAVKAVPAVATIVAAGVAVAFRATIWGELAASSVIASMVVRIPEARGIKVTGMVQL